MKAIIEFYSYRTSQSSGEIFYSERDSQFFGPLRNILGALMGTGIDNHCGFGLKCNDGYEIYVHFSDYRMTISSARSDWDVKNPVPSMQRIIDGDVERGRYLTEAFKSWGKTKQLA